MQIRCNFPDISYLSETQKNNFQFLNKAQETPSFSCFVIWRRLDNVQIKQTSNHIRNAVKICVKTRYLNGKIHNGSG